MLAEAKEIIDETGKSGLFLSGLIPCYIIAFIPRKYVLWERGVYKFNVKVLD